jgi:hypothetical protein
VELRHLDRAFDRSKRSVVGLIIESDEDEQPFYLGSGVVVRLGGRDFILTAGHNVWSTGLGRPAKIAVGRPPDGLSTLIHPGDGSAGAVYHPTPAFAHKDPEPDVAVVEPTDTTILPRPLEPFGEDEIVFFDTNRTVPVSKTEASGRQLVVTGFPVRFASFGPGLAIDPRVGTRGDIGATLVSMAAFTIPAPARKEHPFPAEPTAGRGVHVYFSRRMEDQAGNITRLESPAGFSGGPLVFPEGDGLLVGLARGAIDHLDGWDEWCEPAAEAVRLLVDHREPEVAVAARRVWERYERDIAMR